MFEARVDNSHDSFLRDRVRLILVDPEGRRAFSVVTTVDEYGGLISADTVVDLNAENVRETIRPVLDLPDFLARTVYDALRDLYEPEVADERRLRREDYLRAEGRVDRLLDVVTRLALDGVEE